MEEIWKDIKGFEGYYKISSQGRVLGLKRNKILIPSKTRNRQGHQAFIVGLSACKIKKYIQIHREVYRTFIGEPKGMIDFKDGDFTNYKLDNLIDVISTGKFKKEHSFKVLDTETMKMYDSVNQLAIELGKAHTTVLYGLKNKTRLYTKYKII